jgi:tryptophan 2,3-dioxygenase
MDDAGGHGRRIEDEVVRDLEGRLTYAEYLHLDELLAAQRPRSQPEHHDELLFIVQHQTSELWLKLMLHELHAVRGELLAGELRPALKGIARVKQILRTLTEQWSVLATLTPSEYLEFRGFLGPSSGFQSEQYRAVEFLLGNKDKAMLPVFDHDPPARERLAHLLEQPSVYDAFLIWLNLMGHPIPDSALERDRTRPHELDDDLVSVLARIYEDPHAHWEAYEACEELVDLEEAFQLWRFRHLKTVERLIGSKPGTGGSSGVNFLRRALDITFFPELYALRTELEG